MILKSPAACHPWEHLTDLSRKVPPPALVPSMLSSPPPALQSPHFSPQSFPLVSASRPYLCASLDRSLSLQNYGLPTGGGTSLFFIIQKLQQILGDFSVSFLSPRLHPWMKTGQKCTFPPIPMVPIHPPTFVSPFLSHTHFARCVSFLSK